MMTHDRLPDSDIVLLGAGHTHLHVMRMWRMAPLPRARLTCVSPFTIATYSGMLPGVLAGHYPPSAMQIDLVRLSAAAGVRLLLADAVGIDLPAAALQLADRPALGFDALSIGIGSVPTFDGVVVGDQRQLVAVKPMQTILARIDAVLAGVPHGARRRPVRVLVAGAGAAGVELAFALPRYVRAATGLDVDTTLVSAGRHPLSGEAAAGRARVALGRAGIAVLASRRVVAIDGGHVTLSDGDVRDADLVVWATGAAGPPMLGRLGLPTDERGFLLTDATLRASVSPPIFAVGDTGTSRETRTAKAGVFAVRQGPVLWDNLNRLSTGRPLRRYHPQRAFLRLIGTGDGRAIASWHGLTLTSRLAWRVKDRIDRRFMAQYRDLSPMPMTPPPRMPASLEPRCVGCGGKVGSDVLTSVLARLDLPSRADVPSGVREGADVATLLPHASRALAATVDFFVPPIDDAFLAGRLAALNAVSDLLAARAVPWTALAIVGIPPGRAAVQTALLHELLAGGVRELEAVGARLAGGHTIETSAPLIGFSLLGHHAAAPESPRHLRPGDQIVLTKAVGTGVLLAAHMRARCDAAWFEALLASMLRGHSGALRCLDGLDVSAITDVTGFGLAGHLLRVLDEADLAARVSAGAVPLLPGVRDLLDTGLESTMSPANRAAEARMSARPALLGTPAYTALFDPQTCGGLLVGVSAADAGTLVARLHDAGCAEAAVIATVRPALDARRLAVEP
ncbi:MAG: selenide, water dikinase SelD [Vicinamibacterales bacterium]